ncbi:MAG TPA: phosphoribosylanthranilate isomerase [Chitinophagaceae bacterium]|nr:phosphoribosylanthranilate isomerase [Chitinophagaceae bacterium]
MNIKVCGITQLKQLQQLDGMDIDFAGLIFHKASPRYVGDKLSKQDLQNADLDLRKVGVFVDTPVEDILQAAEDYALDVIQLHGNETPYECEELSEHLEVIKVFSIGETDKDIDELIVDYDEVCDYYLFDTSVNGLKGGTGKKFDWKKLSKSKIEKPFFLSGGIGLEDAAKLKQIKHPDFYGVDINSHFEKEPGIKDMARVLQFKLALK